MISSAIRLSPLLALALAACGSGQKNDQALNALDRSLAGNAVNAQDVDPALAASLEDQIMVDPALSAQAKQDANATEVRILKPGEMVTMEFNGERLNLEVDEKQQVTAVRCG